ncbi:hypothetical protein LXA43DRAFT_1007447 [Ganoderma leucocontextum]|nr:hypothetical protein LXA43DRAFT_1007447 [Ganoderma leucocontextum]
MCSVAGGLECGGLGPPCYQPKHPPFYNCPSWLQVPLDCSPSEQRLLFAIYGSSQSRPKIPNAGAQACPSCPTVHGRCRKLYFTVVISSRSCSRHYMLLFGSFHTLLHLQWHLSMMDSPPSIPRSESLSPSVLPPHFPTSLGPILFYLCPRDCERDVDDVSLTPMIVASSAKSLRCLVAALWPAGRIKRRLSSATKRRSGTMTFSLRVLPE